MLVCWMSKTNLLTFPLPWWEGLGEGDRKVSPYNFQNTLHIFKYIIIPKSNYLKPLAPQPSFSLFVALSISGVLTTVQLDYNSFFKADKIYYVETHWLLPTKLLALQLPTP